MTPTTAHRTDSDPQDEGSARSGSRAGPRLMVTALAAGALAVVAVVLMRHGDEPASVPEQVTAAYIDAWNARDAQAVSGLTCQWVGAFTPAGIVETQFELGPADGPFVTDYTVVATVPVTSDGRELVAVHLEYVRGGEGRTRQVTLYVREDDDHAPCLATFTTF
jgi:hypothetical protein